MSAFQNYFVNTIKTQYADFEGRASRSEFWYFQLFYILIYIALLLVGGALGAISDTLTIIPMILVGILVLGIIVPSLALSIRRLHDTSKSGWFLLVVFIPIIGSIILIVLMCMDSTPGSNEFGPHPYEEGGISSAQSFNDIIDR